MYKRQMSKLNEIKIQNIWYHNLMYFYLYLIKLIQIIILMI